MTYYRHTQRGNGTVFACLAFALLLVVTGAAARAPGVLMPAIVVLLAVSMLFRSLTVEITEAELVCAFGPGLIRRHIPLGAIVAADPARNRWWYGWGIRLTPCGWMFNISGLSAVQLTLEGNKRFRIGTDDPERLAEAIRERLSSPGT